MRPVLLIVLMLATLPIASSAQSHNDGDLSGVYVCNGVNPDGRAYRGVVQIAKYHDSYEVHWSFGTEVAAVGIGIRSGNVLAVTYFSGVPGVVAYKIEEGSLVGEWTVVGADGDLFTETLTKTTADALPSPPPDRAKPEGAQPDVQLPPDHPRVRPAPRDPRSREI